MNTVNVCITETQSLSCFIYFLYDPKFSLVKKGTSCSPAVMYSLSKPYSSETSKSEPGYARLAIISSEHTQERIWQKGATMACCRVLLLLSECSLGLHSTFNLLFLTVNVYHKQSHQVMDFSLFLLALYLSWDNFRISEMSSISKNKTTKKTPCW